MSHDNDIADVEITLALKKIHVLGPIIFRGCSTPQKIEDSSKVLGSKIFRD